MSPRSFIISRLIIVYGLWGEFNYTRRFLKKTIITPVNGISLSDFRSSLSASAIMSKLTWHYPLNSCTFLTSGYAIAKRKHRFFEPEKHFIQP